MTYTRVRWIPGGDAGTRVTLRAMRRLARRSLTDPLLLATAARIVGEGRAGVPWAWRVREWLEDHWRFLPDPLTVELVREPRVMLQELGALGYMAGDCDDAAVMAAALGMAGGLRARFKVLGFVPGGEFSHVYTELRDGGQWVEQDVTRPAQFPEGLLPARVSFFEA